MIRNLFKAARIDELNDLTDAAEHRLQSIGGQIRANLIPPLWRELPNYNRTKFRADLLAGATVAVVTIPQAIGFALIIGLPMQAVLATAIIGAVVCACFSSSHHLVFGPTNTISIILAGAVLSLSDVPLSPLEKVLLIGCLIGLTQLAAGLLRLGQTTQFISRTVIIAYTTAVGLLIAASQISNLLGLSRPSEISLPGTLRHLAASFLNLDFNPATATVGVTSLLVLVALRRWRSRWPDGLIVMCLAGGISAAADLDVWGVPLVRDLGEVVAHVPPFVGFPFNLESLKLIPRITSVAIAVALLGMLEAVAIAKSLAVRSGQHIDPNQELIGMGLGNLTSSFFGAMPGSASFLRSATNLQSGGLTQFATIMGCGFILLIILLISPLLNFIPVAALAAYLIFIALRLFKLKDIAVARSATRGDAAVFWITLIAALFLNLDTAIYTGIGVSLIFFLQKASAPTLVEHAFDEQGQLSEIGAPEKRNHPQVSIVHVEGDLFFGAADLFQEGVRRLARDPSIRVFILRMKNARHLDATTVLALDQLLEHLQADQRHLLISGTHGDVTRVLQRSGLARRIGHDNIFPAEENPTLATKKALRRAQVLIGTKPDLRVFYQQAGA
ncbi:MAG TPA: SulP family inorganic anion transporter [Lacunisphaera sp.]|nr:SulP family inorganic anion transporter [Lacunisphaera sp.]